jgi:hypothetical protein
LTLQEWEPKMETVVKRLIRMTMAGAIAGAIAVSATAAQQAPAAQGTLAGKATDEAKEPYTDYAVQVRDVTTGQVVLTRSLSAQGQFSFPGLSLAKPFLVELFHQKERRVICTEGPFTLTTAVPSKADVNISCGKAPAALWLLLAGAGAAAAVAVATRSVSR